MERNRTKIILISENTELPQWMREQKQAWQVASTCTLQCTNPQHDLMGAGIIMIYWHQTPTFPASQQDPQSPRSCEGVVDELNRIGGQDLLQKVIVVSDNLSRENIIFLSEYDIKNILIIPSKKQNWNPLAIQQKISDTLAKIKSAYQSEVESNVLHFEMLLSSWNRISDEVKMTTIENLLKVLGDSARYFELIARKCIKEQDPLGAELWLKKSISKNDSYLQAFRTLADLYFDQKNFRSALTIYEKLKLTNPKNPLRLTKIARCQLQIGEPEKAEKNLQDALQIDRHCADAREELGKLCCLHGRYGEAKSLLSDSHNHKKIAAFLNSIGINLVNKKLYQDSIFHYLQSQYILPTNESAHLLFFNIGLAYAKWGKQDLARRYLHLALIKEPCYEKAQLLLKSLAA